MNQPTTCPQCRSTFEAKTITHQQPWGEELYEFENVPALVCAQCGEVWIGAEVAQLIESVIQRQPQPKRYHQVLSSRWRNFPSSDEKITMTLASGIEIPLQEIAELCRRYKVREMAIFGSAARGEMHPGSDIDVMVEFDPGTNVGWEFFELEE